MCGLLRHTFDCGLSIKLGLLLKLFLLLAVALLQPAIGRHIIISVLVFAQRLHKLADASNVGCLALLGRLVDGLDPSQRRTRREKVQEHGREFVRHLLCGFTGCAPRCDAKIGGGKVVEGATMKVRV